MDTNQIERLAKSAKLKFTEADLKDWSKNMESIFGWLDELSKVDTSSVTEDTAANAQHVRADEASVFPGREAIIAAFTESEDNMAKVKKVL
ncbi:aspartyl/glutamyl-tRNA(Asn/Gln) amidotransferase C subunit [Elusimicrobium simillimum]|uniref:Asp-tRNA(Asn)/Glu-tRNA(Gln) amidotransferase subunit GatC n=1 Tax=Elusimicrobium simillimum TaxID=3143438 RepID=UPI003C6FD64E